MPLLPGFQSHTLRRKPRSAQQKLAEKIALLKLKSFKQIGEVFEKFIPRTLLKQEQDGVMSRRRIFSKENTFWAFFSQVLDADGGCKEVLRRLQSYVSVKGGKLPSSSTASYCTARKKLDDQMLSEIFKHTADRLDKIPVSGLLNNLLDAKRYPAEQIADLYFKRWDVELFFRDIKTTMGMDILRCQTPVMIRKEILMHFIAYNCVRRLMKRQKKRVSTFE